MRDISIHARTPRRILEAALLLGAVAFIVEGVLGWARAGRERRLHSEALQTWEGEGGAPHESQPASRQ